MQFAENGIRVPIWRPLGVVRVELAWSNEADAPQETRTRFRFSIVRQVLRILSRVARFACGKRLLHAPIARTVNLVVGLRTRLEGVYNRRARRVHDLFAPGRKFPPRQHRKNRRIPERRLQPGLSGVGSVTNVREVVSVRRRYTLGQLHLL